jgi:hypothetical protein
LVAVGHLLHEALRLLEQRGECGSLVVARRRRAARARQGGRLGSLQAVSRSLIAVVMVASGGSGVAKDALLVIAWTIPLARTMRAGTCFGRWRLATERRMIVVVPMDCSPVQPLSMKSGFSVVM